MNKRRSKATSAQPSLPTAEPTLLPHSTEPTPDVGEGGIAAAPKKDLSQIERANKLAHEREDGERDGHIAGMCEAAAMALARAAADRADDNSQWACATERLADEYIAELRRRYGLEHERVRHHMRLRDLDRHIEDMHHRGIL